MLNQLDKLLCKLPALVFASWFIYVFILYPTGWYSKHQEFLDDLDTVLVGIVVIHGFFLFGFARYNNTKRILFIAIVLILIIQGQYMYGLISTESYLRTYKHYLIATIITIFLEAFINKD